jgi:inorganic pyrophosphatase
MNFEVDGIVEIPKGSRYKYEIDKHSGALILDRPLNQTIPHNYGFVPNSLCPDGDPLDVFIIGPNPLVPLTKVKLQLVGAFVCMDNGVSDDKLLAVVSGESILDNDLQIFMDDIWRYLSTYKSGFVVEKLVLKDEAYQILMEVTDAYVNG